MENLYDAIVVGARCAGSPTAMLLARKGYKVLLVDKAAFPSDTISTHIIFPPGAELLQRWGLLEKVIATNCPVISDISFDFGDFTLAGSPPLPRGIPGIVAPRRILLDKILTDAAVDAGVELRENCHVEEILLEDGVVTGIRCQDKGGATHTVKARIVIGADGRNSFVARSVKAKEYNVVPSLTSWYYTYWSGLPATGLMFYSRPDRAIGVIPTNDGLVCMPVVWPAKEFHEYRSDIEGNYLKTIDLVDELAGLMEKAKRVERFFGMADLPNFFRKSSGPGWALVGDSANHKDPITGHGISDAFYGATLLAEAVDAGFSGKEPLDKALLQYEQTRDHEKMPMFGFTCEQAKLKPPPPEMQAVLGALQGNQVETDRFFGVMAGTVPIPEFFEPGNIGRIMNTVKT